MAAIFFDMDDSLVKHGSNDFLDGAVDLLKAIKANGHQLFITTRRGDEWEAHHVYGRQLTERFIRGWKEFGVDVDGIIYNVESPRIIVNDGGAVGITHPAGQPLDYIVNEFGILPKPSEVKE